MKAIIYGGNPTGAGDYRVNVLYYTGAAFTSGNVVSLAGVDFDANPLPADIQSAIIADATGQGYTITASDIFDGNDPHAASSSVTRSQSSTTRTLNSAYQISTTQDAFVAYTVDVAATLSLSGGQSGQVVLEIATNSGFTTGVQTVQSAINGNTGTLTIGLNMTTTSSATLTGYVPKGMYARLRTVNTTGTPTFTYRTGQETLM